MVFEAHNFLLNIAAVDQERAPPEHTFPVRICAQQFLQARLTFRVSLQHRAPVILYNLHGSTQVIHAFAEFALNAAPFLFPHLIQSFERFAYS